MSDEHVAVLDEVTQAYEAAKDHNVRSQTANVEQKLRDAFATRRTEINEQIESLRDVFTRHVEAASASSRRYGALFRHRVHKSEIRPPSLWERIISFNAVDRLFREAERCVGEAEREESVRKPDGLVALRNDPMVHAAFVKLQHVKDDRARFDERVTQGIVALQEARDCDMAERGMSLASAPL